jgi:hypothetical protein
MLGIGDTVVKQRKVKIGYKVVRMLPGGKRVSIFFGCHAQRVEVAPLEYPAGVKVHRPKYWGPLAVFHHRADAVSFRRYQPNTWVVQCQYLPSRQRGFWYRTEPEELFKLAVAWLHSGKTTRPPARGGKLPHNSTPDGTRYADWVKCLE